MSDTPLVSVVLPVYNGAAYLAEALASVQAQTYRPIEMIVVDDGSTDASGDVARQATSQARLLYQANQGAGAARNRGVAEASGDLLAFLDQDDVWVSEKLAWQVSALDADPTLDIVFGHVQQFFSPDLDTASRARLHCPDHPQPGLLPSALLIRRAAFERVGAFERGWRVAEWAEWYVRAVDLGMRAVMLPQVVARRRLHAANTGLAARNAAPEYARLLKARLDRRRG
ncbi:MAG: glycosyltransferase family 2 protein [Anaerolineae bacterium]|nr:glycosyltransferase family 2 protein [Anaerolineae bacterium]